MLIRVICMFVVRLTVPRVGVDSAAVDVGDQKNQYSVVAQSQ